MPKAVSILNVVYNELGRTPAGGLQLTEDISSLDTQAGSAKSGFSGSSIFSVDRGSIFSFSSNISKLSNAFSRSEIDENAPRKLRASHSFLEEHSGSSTSEDDDEDDSGSESDASTATLGASPAKPVMIEYYPRKRNPARFLHSIVGAKNRITLVLDSIGAKDKPIYVQNVFSTVAGKVLLRLQDDDEQVKVYLTGTSIAGIPQGIGSGIGALSVIESDFFSSDTVLWSRKSSERPQSGGVLREWLFSLPIPAHTPVTKRQPPRVPMPPTFELNAGKNDNSPGTVSLASVQYMLKVVITKANLMKSKERLVAPIVYLTQTDDLAWLSQERRRAMMEHMPIAGPQRDWAKHVETFTFEKHLFKTNKTAFRLELLLPSPLKYARQETLPFEVRVCSKDFEALEQLEASSLQVLLTQRALAHMDNISGRKETTSESSHIAVSDALDHTAEGEACRTFSGTLTLRTANVVSFKLAHMQLQYRIMCGITIPGQMPSWTWLNIEIANIPTLYQHAEDHS